MNVPSTLILTGPTASGKSSLAMEMATAVQKIEMINADSLLIYRGMDIGTAKPTLSEQRLIPHHLIDIRQPDESFTVGDFCRAVKTTLHQIHSRGNRALIVGGTGFYLKALFFGLWDLLANVEISNIQKKRWQDESCETLYLQLQNIDPITAQKIGKTDHYRLVRSLCVYHQTQKTPSELHSALRQTPDPQFHLWIIDRHPEELQKRIEQRTHDMLHQGLLAEVQALQSQFPNCRPLSAVGYLQVCRYLSQSVPLGRKIKPGLPGLQEEIQLATRQLVKRQRTWLRQQFQSVIQKKAFHLDADRLAFAQAFRAFYL